MFVIAVCVGYFLLTLLFNEAFEAFEVFTYGSP